MKLIGLKRLAGLALAAAVIGGPLAGSALAQTAGRAGRAAPRRRRAGRDAARLTPRRAAPPRPPRRSGRRRAAAAARPRSTPATPPGC